MPRAGHQPPQETREAVQAPKPQAGTPMSAPDTPIVMSIILELRHYQVLLMQEGPDRWFAVISERGTGHGTRPLGSIETQDGAAAALHLALTRILEMAGIP